MKTPKFFYQKKSFLAFLLFPFSVIFFLISILRNSLIKPQKLENKFVICIGNSTVGGAGKTPSAIFLGEILKEMGLEFCFLSKGYGRKTKGFFALASNQNAIETGDEPQILKQTAPVYLFSKYCEIVQNLSKIKEKIIIMDDGMQNPSIQKDITISIIDGNLQFGNGFLLPAGPLRELPKFAKKPNLTFQIEGSPCENRIILNKNYELINAGNISSFIAFSGLAINEKFFSSLEKLHLNIIRKIEYEDHHIYTSSEIAELMQLAKNLNCRLITTEKDIVKIDATMKNQIAVLKLKLFASEAEKEQIKKFLQILRD